MSPTPQLCVNAPHLAEGCSHWACEAEPPPCPPLHQLLLHLPGLLLHFEASREGNRWIRRYQPGPLCLPSLSNSASPPSVTPPQTAHVEHLLPLAPSCSGLSPLVLVSSPDCLSSGAGLPFFTAGSSSFLLLALPRPSAQQVLSSTGRFCVGPVKRLLIGSFLV